jgi:hypothetical protein
VLELQISTAWWCRLALSQGHAKSKAQVKMGKRVLERLRKKSVQTYTVALLPGTVVLNERAFDIGGVEERRLTVVMVILCN